MELVHMLKRYNTDEQRNTEDSQQSENMPSISRAETAVLGSARSQNSMPANNKTLIDIINGAITSKECNNINWTINPFY